MQATLISVDIAEGLLDAELRADFTACHAGFATDLGICVPREYWLTLGARV
jgi:hypothetical protein